MAGSRNQNMRQINLYWTINEWLLMELFYDVKSWLVKVFVKLFAPDSDSSLNQMCPSLASVQGLRPINPFLTNVIKPRYSIACLNCRWDGGAIPHSHSRSRLFHWSGISWCTLGWRFPPATEYQKQTLEWIWSIWWWCQEYEIVENVLFPGLACRGKESKKSRMAICCGFPLIGSV